MIAYKRNISALYHSGFSRKTKLIGCWLLGWFKKTKLSVCGPGKSDIYRTNQIKVDVIVLSLKSIGQTKG